MANTNIDEVKELLGFLHPLYTSLWQLHINAREPDLTPARFVIPPTTGLHSDSWKAGERAHREGADVLDGMLEY